MDAYLERAIIVAQPMGLIRPSEVINQASRQLRFFNKSKIRFDLYTATPDQIDMHDSVVRFIVYAFLAGFKVVPISQQLENARVISINA